MGEWYTNPSWWEAIGTVGATLMALFHTNLRRYLEFKKRPIIEISCGNKEPYCRPAIVDSVGSIGYFIRLKVENKGKSIAKNCEGKLNNIYEPVTKILHIPFDPVVLNWVGHNKGPININSGEYEYLDLLIIFEKNITNIHIAVEDTTPRGISIHPEMKDWILDVCIFGENVEPVFKSYKFIKADKFDDVKIEEYVTHNS